MQQTAELNKQENTVRFTEDVDWKANGYTVNRNPVMFDPYISAKAKIIYLQLRARDFNNKGFSFPGLDKIAGENGYKSNSTVRKYINELVDAGLLEKKQRGINKTNVYTFKKLSSRYPQYTPEDKDAEQKEDSSQEDSGNNGEIDLNQVEVQEEKPLSEDESDQQAHKSTQQAHKSDHQELVDKELKEVRIKSIKSKSSTQVSDAIKDKVTELLSRDISSEDLQRLARLQDEYNKSKVLDACKDAGNNYDPGEINSSALIETILEEDYSKPPKARRQSIKNLIGTQRVYESKTDYSEPDYFSNENSEYTEEFRQIYHDIIGSNTHSDFIDQLIELAGEQGFLKALESVRGIEGKPSDRMQALADKCREIAERR